MQKVILRPCLILILAITFVISSVSSAYAEQQTPIPIAINGQELPLEAGAISVERINMVPLKLLRDICGYELFWNDTTKTAIMNKDEEIIRVSLGSNTANVNGETKFMERAPMIVDGRILVPMSFLNENTELEVYWSPVNRKINIHDPNLKSQYSDEIQEKLINRMVKAINKADGQLDSLDIESYAELVIFKDIKDVKLNEKYKEECLSFTTIYDRQKGKLGRDIIVEFKPVGGNKYNPAKTEYSIGKINEEDYRIDIYDGLTKMIYESIEEQLQQEDESNIVKEPLSNVDKKTIKRELKNETKILKNKWLEVVGAERVYVPERKIYQATFDTYMNNKGIVQGEIPNIYPLNKITKIHDNINNHISLGVGITEGRESLGYIDYEAILNVDIQKDYADKIGIEDGNNIWLYAVLNHKIY